MENENEEEEEEEPKKEEEQAVGLGEKVDKELMVVGFH